MIKKGKSSAPLGVRPKVSGRHSDLSRLLLRVPARRSRTVRPIADPTAARHLTKALKRDERMLREIRESEKSKRRV